MNTKRIISILAFVGGLSIASSAQASVNWSIVGTADGEPDLIGTVITPDIPAACDDTPVICGVSGTLTIPDGALGGTGTTIDLAVDPGGVVIGIATSPPAPGDVFFVFAISKDGYTCDSSSSFVLQCDFDSTTAFYDLVLTEQVPKVVIGNGNVLITGQLEVAGQIIKPAAPTVYSIGDEGPGGGIVFYLTFDGQHGLEAAPVDQANVQWGCFSTAITGADGLTFGTGARNTADIIAGCTTSNIAADIADDYSLGGFDDWFLPSKDELNELYRNRVVVGGFASDFYWSSSEFTGGLAWYQNFDNGNQYGINKNNSNRVRAVRAF